MIKRTLLAALLLTLAGCKDPGSAVNEPPPMATAIKGAPDASLVEGVKVQGATLKAIRARGHLNCGVNTGLIGFAFTDNGGKWQGFDIDFCHATAAVIFGDPNAVRFIPLGSTERFTALQSGEVDVLWRNTSWTFSRDTGNHLDFAGINYFDGQGFLVRRSLNLHSAAELTGARICVQTGSTTELNVADFFRSKGIKYTPVVVDTEDQAHADYAREACDALTADMSELASVRTILDDPNAHMLLPEVISKEPFGPVVRQGDSQWEDVIRWTLNATLLAEELGITRENVDDVRRTSTNPEIRRLLGVEHGYGAMLGVSDDWAYRIIKNEGNYGQIFERNLGKSSALKLDRGMNALWNAQPKPGLMYAPPLR
jgi:general L-amino acid transport system substrate-binding protein